MLAAKWQPEGVFLNEETGERTVGRDAIAQHFQALFNERSDLTLGGQLDSIRFVRPEVARVTGYAITVGSDNEPLESSFKAILVRVEDQWLFDSIDERPLPFRTKPYEQLDTVEAELQAMLDEQDFEDLMVLL